MFTFKREKVETGLAGVVIPIPTCRLSLRNGKLDIFLRRIGEAKNTNGVFGYGLRMAIVSAIGH